MNRNRAVFLDRDGTLNHDIGYTHRVEDFRLLEHVVEGLRLMSGMGFKLVITTNQSGIARGYFTEREMEIFNQHLLKDLESHNIIIDAVYYCPYHPTDGEGHFKQLSSSRKPNPGMLIQAAREHGIDLRQSYVVGDRQSDILAGKRAGCATILLAPEPGLVQESQSQAVPDHVAGNLLEAAMIMQDIESGRSKRAD